MKFPVIGAAHKVNGVIFITLLAVMFFYSIPKVFYFGESQKNMWSDFLDGKLLRKFENFYDKDFFLRDPSLKAWAGVRFLLFNEGMNGVVIGKDGWLYTNQEYLASKDFLISLDKQVEKIIEVKGKLEKSGKNLVVLPIPLKVDIYQEYSKIKPKGVVLDLYDTLVIKLQSNGVNVTPIRNEFFNERNNKKLYITNDTHWSAEGALLAAEVFSNKNSSLLGSTGFESNKIGVKSYTGDLMYYIKFGDGLVKKGNFLPVEIDLYETTKKNQELNTSSLFDDDGSSLILVGTSYSKMENWNFLGFMQEKLKSGIVSFSQEAHGPFQAMDLLLNSPELHEENLSTVIWEFPVRTVLVQSMMPEKSISEQSRQF